jgi:hypothetical protein
MIAILCEYEGMNYRMQLHDVTSDIANIHAQILSNIDELRDRHVSDFTFMYYDSVFEEYAALNQPALSCISNVTKLKVKLLTKTVSVSNTSSILQSSNDTVNGTKSLLHNSNTLQPLAENNTTVTDSPVAVILSPAVREDKQSNNTSSTVTIGDIQPIQETPHVIDTHVEPETVVQQSPPQSILRMQPISDDVYAINQLLDQTFEVEDENMNLIAQLQQEVHQPRAVIQSPNEKLHSTATKVRTVITPINPMSGLSQLLLEQQPEEKNTILLDNSKNIKEVFLQNCHESQVKIDDMFGSDLGYIVIDCLLEQTVADTEAKRPWEYNKNTGISWELYGGQILHLVYLVEKTLKSWKLFHPNLDLVYFKNCVPSFDLENHPRMMGLYLLARQILFDHLYAAKLFENYHVFDSNWSSSDEFSQYMKLKRPAFICVPYFDRDFTFWSLCKYDTSVILKPDTTKDHFVGYLITIKQKALINQMLIRDCRDLVTNWVPHMFIEIEKQMDHTYISTELPTSNMSEKEFRTIDLEDSFQDILVNSLITACRNMEKVNHNLITAFLATIIMQPTCSIEHRAVVLDVYYPILNILLDKVYLAVCRRLTVLSIDGSSLLDLFDGKLCHNLLYRIESFEEAVLQSNEDIRLYECVLEHIDPIKLSHDRLEFKTTDTFVTEYVFDDDVQITDINNSLIKHDKLIVQIKKKKSRIPSDDSADRVFREVFHWHSSRRLEEFKQSHEALLDWARKLKQNKSVITAFPEITGGNFALIRLQKHKEIIASNLVLKDWIKEHASQRNEWISQIDTIQREVEKVEYDEAFLEGTHKEFLETVYNLELQCFENELQKLESRYCGSAISESEDCDLDYDQQVYIWKILCWTRFIYEFMKWKQQYIHASRREQVAESLKGYLRRACLFHEVGDEDGQDIISTNKLHLLMSIREKSPTPLLKQFKNTKVKLLQEIDKKIHNAASTLEKLNNENNQQIVRNLMIKKNIVSDLSFIPDKWQLRLMEHLDLDHTVLVSAPTSAGKSFISSYLIKRILYLSDDGLVVLIVPSNALVNQVYLDIYTSLGKESSDNDIRDHTTDKTIGIYTKDQRINLDVCQVLISTPNMFEIMVLSQTSSNQRIKKRIRYLILDEIHSMNSEGGSCWETIMMMIRCPILALSATLGNPEPFMNWLKTIRREHEVHLVECQHRFVPLSYFLYNPDDYSYGIQHIHPMAALNPYQFHEKELERLPILGIKECFEFLAVTEEMYDEHNPFEAFCDGSFLGDNRNKCISRKQVIRFQKELTEKIRSLCNDEEHSEIMMSICAKLRQPIQNIYNTINSIMTKESYFNNYQFNLIKKLREIRLLPAICFIFDKTYINDMVENLYDQLLDDSEIYDLWQDPTTSLKGRMEIEKSIEILKDIRDLPDIAIPALRKGIGMHYASLDNVYQKEVERLLKANLLPLVLATSTLSLGVVSKFITIFLCVHMLTK